MFRRLLISILSVALVLQPYAVNAQSSTAEKGNSGAVPGNFHSLSNVSATISSAGEQTVGEPGPATLSAFLPDLFTGNIKFPLSLDLPSFRPNLAVALSPQYLAGRMGLLGMGWDIIVPRIQRATKFGIDYNKDSYELISSDGTADLISKDRTLFRIRSDSRYTEIKRTPQGFVLYSPAGTRTYFGTDAGSQARDPNNSEKTYAWLASSIVDRFGNTVNIEYESHEGSPLVRRLAQPKARV
jgi:hypothetical protein